MNHKKELLRGLWVKTINSGLVSLRGPNRKPCQQDNFLAQPYLVYLHVFGPAPEPLLNPTPF